MEKELQELVDQLGSAIDETIAESSRIGEIVHEMERAGYDVTLVLEATMRFTPKDRPEEDSHDIATHSELSGMAPSGSGMALSGKFDLTPQDEEFLQALHVAV